MYDCICMRVSIGCCACIVMVMVMDILESVGFNLDTLQLVGFGLRGLGNLWRFLGLGNHS